MAPAAVSETVGGGLPRVNVWVGMRVRPISRREAATGDVSCWEVQSDGATLVYREPVIRESIPEPEESTKAPLVPPVAFDAAFPPECGGGEVYRVSAQPLVLGACEGVNGTVFAYGQTGSGKTHTMRPLMAAACEEVFGYISRTPGREFLIRVSATEIYNEDLKDLLSLDPSASGLKLMDCPTRGTVAEGLTEVGKAPFHLGSFVSSGLSIQQLSLPFPCTQPPGVEHGFPHKHPRSIHSILFSFYRFPPYSSLMDSQFPTSTSLLLHQLAP